MLGGMSLNLLDGDARTSSETPFWPGVGGCCEYGVPGSDIPGCGTIPGWGLPIALDGLDTTRIWTGIWPDCA
jgi:hypothetical protein